MNPRTLSPCFVIALLAACGGGGTTDDAGGGATSGTGGSGSPTTDAPTLGEEHTGQYHLGPVDFAETEWHNACAPGGGYRSELRSSIGLSGEYLAGVSNELSLSGGLCDACMLIETAAGKSIVARIVTYGVEQDPNDIDVSPSVFEALHQDEYPRTMTWSLAKCPDAGSIQYEFQTEANEWWTSLWVRGARVPLAKVEVKSTNHPEFIELARGTDGTLTDASGFGQGPFTLRLTGSDGQVIEDELDGFTPGALVDSGVQFD
jgi:expansin